MGRMLLASNENDDNYTSVGDCGHLLQEIYKQDTSGYTHAADMFNLLKAQTRCNKIPAQLPEGVKTANKTGELDNVENDAGIIYDSKNVPESLKRRFRTEYDRYLKQNDLRLL